MSDVQVSYYRARYYDPQVGRFLSEDPRGPVHGWLNWEENQQVSGERLGALQNAALFASGATSGS